MESLFGQFNMVLATVSSFAGSGVVSILAALVHMLGDREFDIRILRQATHPRIPTLKKGRKVLLINHPWHNQDELNDFVSQLVSAGHTIVGIIDDFGKTAWSTALSNAGIDINTLNFSPLYDLPKKPTPMGDSYTSVQTRMAGQLTDPRALFLLDENQSASIHDIMDKAMNCIPSEYAHRARILAGHFAKHDKPNGEIRLWKRLGDFALARKHEHNVEQGEDLGNGIWRIDSVSPSSDGKTFRRDVSVAYIRHRPKILVIRTTDETYFLLSVRLDYMLLCFANSRNIALNKKYGLNVVNSQHEGRMVDCLLSLDLVNDPVCA